MNKPTDDSVLFSDLYALIAEHRARYKPLPRRFEMSTATLRTVEARLNKLKFSNFRASTLWGIELVMNESLPLNEIKPIYE